MDGYAIFHNSIKISRCWRDQLNSGHILVMHFNGGGNIDVRRQQTFSDFNQVLHGIFKERREIRLSLYAIQRVCGVGSKSLYPPFSPSSFFFLSAVTVLCLIASFYGSVKFSFDKEVNRLFWGVDNRSSFRIIKWPSFFSPHTHQFLRIWVWFSLSLSKCLWFLLNNCYQFSVKGSYTLLWR